MRLGWDNSGEKFYETGVDRGVLYPSSGIGVPWNGLISVKEAPSESDVSTNYVDGRKYRTRHTPGAFAATVEAITFPDEFEEQKPFGLTYRTKIGTDITGLDHGYKLHLVYNALAAPVSKDYSTLNSSPEALPFQWDISTTPIRIAGAQPSAHLIVDTTKAYSWTVEAFEALLYGTEEHAPVLPSPESVLELFDANAIVKITDNGDGTWTAEGPDEVIQMLDPSTFQISWASAVYIDSDTYSISSL